MFKIITLFTFFLKAVSADLCFTPLDILNKGFVSYNDKVYDIANYIHPGGSMFIRQARGKPLETFFNIKSYSFHTTSGKAQNDLAKSYVGYLSVACNNNNGTFTVPTPFTEPIDYCNDNLNNILDNENFVFGVSSTALLLSLVSSFYVITHSKTCCNSFLINNIKICNFYTSKARIFFIVSYLVWWISLLIYSVMTKDVLEKLGLWNALNVALTIFPVTRNSVWINTLNLSYDKLISMHKLMAILCVISVIIKITFVLLQYDINFILVYKIEGLDGSPLMGTISSLSIFVTLFLAVPILRRNFYEVFYYTHKLLCLITVVAAVLHKTSTLYYISLPIFLYIIDIILRLIYTKKVIYSKLLHVGSDTYKTSCMFITLSLTKPLKVVPGCYFFICFKDVSRIEWHPLSLVSQSYNNLVFCIKDMGGKSWSNKLKNLDNRIINRNIVLNNEVFLQGPYGHLDINYKKNKYKYIINIANGIGITPYISIINDINEMFFLQKLSNLKKIILIWIIPHISLLIPFSKLLSSYNKNLVEIRVYITKTFEDDSYDNNTQGYPLTIIFNKPVISDIIDVYMNELQVSSNDVCVLCCGSYSLTQDVYSACSKHKIDVFNDNFEF